MSRLEKALFEMWCGDAITRNLRFELFEVELKRDNPTGVSDSDLDELLDFYKNL